MTKRVIPFVFSLLTLVACKSHEEPLLEELQVNLTTEQIDEIVQSADKVNSADCKVATWQDVDNFAFEEVENEDVTVFTQEATRCVLGNGLIKYVYNEYYHEYHGENIFYEKDGKLIYVVQNLNSEGYEMTRRFYYDLSGKLLKGSNTDLMDEEDPSKPKEMYRDNFNQHIEDDNKLALSQFETVRVKFD